MSISILNMVMVALAALSLMACSTKSVRLSRVGLGAGKVVKS